MSTSTHPKLSKVLSSSEYLSTQLLGALESTPYYLDSLFSTLYIDELARGGTGHEAHHRRLLFIQSLQSSIVRATAKMAASLSTS